MCSFLSTCLVFGSFALALVALAMLVHVTSVLVTACTCCWYRDVTLVDAQLGVACVINLLYRW